MPEMDRRLAAILAADVVDYSRLMSTAEEETHRRLNSYIAAIKEIAGRHKGRVFGNFGDSIVVEFASSMEAVRSAIEMQSDFKTRNAALPENQRMLVRIGINVGDVLIQGDSLYGDSVNIAARLEGLARPGGIDISGEVFRQVNKKLDCEFKDLGEKRVKNIQEPIHVYEVCADKARADGGKRRLSIPLGKRSVAAALALVAIVAGIAVATLLSRNDDAISAASASVAVLPMKNLSGDPGQDYIGDGITNDLITDLSKFPSLFVPSSYSSYFYKGQTVKLQQVARELGVRYILEGTIQKEHTSLRINAQLIDVQTGKHVWAERYTYPDAHDLFAIQDSIVEQVVTRVADKVTTLELDRVTKERTTNMDAQTFYMQGVAAYGDECETLEACDDSRELFEKAIDADNSFARAHGWLAYVLAQGWYHGFYDESVLDTALQHAEAAVQLDKDDPENNWSLAEVEHRRGNMQRAYDEYKKATDKSTDADLHANFAELLNKMGDHAGALTEIDKAFATTKKGVPDYFYWDKAYILYFMKDHRGSLDELEKMADRPVWSGYLFAANHAKLGDQTQASTEMQNFQNANEETKDWTIGKEYETEASTFAKDEDRIYWLKGLKEAGMEPGDLPPDIVQQLEP